MITVHISPSTETVSIEHLPQGDIILTPEQAWSVLQRLKERSSDIYDMVIEREKKSKIRDRATHPKVAHDDEVRDELARWLRNERGTQEQ